MLLPCCVCGVTAVLLSCVSRGVNARPLQGAGRQHEQPGPPRKEQEPKGGGKLLWSEVEVHGTLCGLGLQI